MPFYEYACTACGAHTEILQRLSDPPATVCPQCKASALTKQVSAAGFRLKGGGWYETDFKSDGKRNLAGDAGNGATAEAKPAEEGKAKDSEKSGKGEGKSAPEATAATSDKAPKAVAGTDKAAASSASSPTGSGKTAPAPATPGT